MKNARRIIASRLSCRAFNGEPIVAKHRGLLTTSIVKPLAGPLGTTVRVVEVENSPTLNADLEERCSYGSVHGAPSLLVPVVPRERHAMEDVGAIVERLLLELEGSGIGSCWFVGNFAGGAIEREVAPESNSVLPAVIPIGYRATRRTASDSAIRFSVGSRKRKRWSELYFEIEFWDDDQRPNTPPTPLSPAEAPDIEEMLEAVRLAPSTSNNQPWRIYRYTTDSGPDRLHLCLKRNPGMDKVIRDVDVQKIDAGVAMAHFQAVAEEIGMSGAWVYDKPAYLPHGVEYVASWSE